MNEKESKFDSFDTDEEQIDKKREKRVTPRCVHHLRFPILV